MEREHEPFLMVRSDEVLEESYGREIRRLGNMYHINVRDPIGYYT
jgi:hypothetical protein